MEKKCIRCSKVVPIEGFYKHSMMADGHLNVCMECVKKRVATRLGEKMKDPIFVANERKRTRERNVRLGYAQKYKPVTKEQKEARRVACKKWIERNPAKRQAHMRVDSAIKRKKLVKAPCFCGEVKVEAHHPDYLKPLEIVWLCRKHHAQAHRKD